MVPTPRWRRRPHRSRQAGQGLVEYALILVLIVIVAISGLIFFGATVSGLLSDIGTSITSV